MSAPERSENWDRHRGGNDSGIQCYMYDSLSRDQTSPEDSQQLREHYRKMISTIYGLSDPAEIDAAIWENAGRAISLYKKEVGISDLPRVVPSDLLEGGNPDG